MEKLDDDTISNLLSVDWHLSDDELDFSDVEDFINEKNNSEDEELEGKECHDFIFTHILLLYYYFNLPNLFGYIYLSKCLYRYL